MPGSYDSRGRADAHTVTRRFPPTSNHSNCVEIAAALTAIHVRDSKTMGGPHLVFQSSAWAPFISHTAPNSSLCQSTEGWPSLDS
ncbi:DUF397 domain-containing protein [Streptomyces pseudovenezuelae]|uniref:DUF397 domain-containing protein n=1 Tax=Streptomyces pseudovenezuelae TaxID=67350 RepID=UPI0036EF111D